MTSTWKKGACIVLLSIGIGLIIGGLLSINWVPYEAESNRLPSLGQGIETINRGAVAATFGFVLTLVAYLWKRSQKGWR